MKKSDAFAPLLDFCLTVGLFLNNIPTSLPFIWMKISVFGKEVVSCGRKTEQDLRELPGEGVHPSELSRAQGKGWAAFKMKKIYIF